MAKKKLPSQMIDFNKLIEKKRLNHIRNIADKAYQKLFPEEKKIDSEMITIGREKVENYSFKILTFRYRDKILVREFPIDIEGLKFQYESPIYDK